jgi:peptidoglycan/xylan/chitin deacetylase (PgdA/CDA1 family)
MDALDEAAHPVRFWWRDDDAGRHAPALDHLLELAARHAVPLALAVVPAWLEAATIEAIEGGTLVEVLQHGWAHESHARPGERKIELGGGEDAGRLASRLAAGRERLGHAFGARFLPVMVPPWNRIDRPVAERLPSLGFEVLSARPDVGWTGMRGLRRLDAHLDIVDWRQTRRVLPLASLAPALAAIVRSCPAEPIGILSHHLVMDDESFGALDRLLTVIMKHPKARIVRAADLVRGGR